MIMQRSKTTNVNNDRPMSPVALPFRFVTTFSNDWDFVEGFVEASVQV